MTWGRDGLSRMVPAQAAVVESRECVRYMTETMQTTVARDDESESLARGLVVLTGNAAKEVDGG